MKWKVVKVMELGLVYFREMLEKNVAELRFWYSVLVGMELLVFRVVILALDLHQDETFVHFDGEYELNPKSV